MKDRDMTELENIFLDFYNKYCKQADWLPYIKDRIKSGQIHIPIFLINDGDDDCYLDVLIRLDKWDIVMSTDGYELDIDEYFKIQKDLEKLVINLSNFKKI